MVARATTRVNSLLLIGALGAVLFAIVSTRHLNKLTEEEVEQNARIMMRSAASISKYTSEEIAPLLEERMQKRFYPQGVSAYAALKNFDFLHAEFPDYSYRESALNPTNPSDRATDWERDVIQYFRANPSNSEHITIRPTLKGPVMNLSRPIRAEERCLVCHDTPQRAPASMRAVYGDNNGFGWKENEIIGAQIVSVPMQLASNRARQNLLFMGIAFGVLVMLGTLLNVVLARTLTRQTRTMPDAEKVSPGQSGAPKFKRWGSDQIARFGQSFTRMRRSLALRMSQPHGD
jgi:protein-histidine pros-kinase